MLLLLLLINGSQHALAVVVEVNKEERSVLLPCQYSSFIPEDPTVMWTRSDLDPKSVHLRGGGGGDDLRGQNQRYSGRTSLRPDALDSGDFSLTLRKPTMTDSGNYTCSISARGHERRLRDIQLQVKDQQVEVKVDEGSNTVILPCKTKPDLPKDTKVEWTRPARELVMVHVYPNRNEHLSTQDDLYTNRTEMNEDLLRTGDLSLTLKHPTERDTGGYICTIYRDKDILRQKVLLQVKERFPFWAKALLVLLVLVVSGGLLFHFRQCFMAGYKVVVDSGVESVQLPCKAVLNMLKDIKVEWKDRDNRMVHVYQSSSDRPEEQDDFYRGRTKMERNLLKPGDLSLTLKLPTDEDTNIYTCTCTVSSREGKILTKKEVQLLVRVPQVQVDSGAESVQLACKATVPLPADVKVEWTNSSHRNVHIRQNGFDLLEGQFEFYRSRTEMNEDMQRTGDLSLTLKHPTDWDTNTYTCTAYSREGTILMQKQVELKVRVCQVKEGAESVQLPFTTTGNLPEDAEVIWWDSADRKVHVYQNGSDQPEEQHQAYRDRTKMNEDLLQTGDLSLTLKLPTDGDSGTYRCKVYGKIKRYKKVQLTVKDCQVEVEEGAESVQLPFRTTGNLPEDAEVVWTRIKPEPIIDVHVYQSGSDQPEEQPEEQHQAYRDRTKMNEDLLRTGDLSLTLRLPTERDSGRYRCAVKRRNIWIRVKTVQLTVKGRAQVQDQTGIIRNRSSSIDPTPLMADQSV